LIFVTVGTHQQPFERLLGALDALDALDGAELVVQYGTGRRPPGAIVAEPYMPFDRMLANFQAAEKVITHAGVGSILCATRAGHVPLVVPRRHDLGEHVDEHQAELTRALESRGSVIAVRDVGLLAELVAAAPARRAASALSAPPLCDEVRAALLPGRG
jgi:UDP-N-acetylglucosamine transferase subunit ALG13